MMEKQGTKIEAYRPCGRSWSARAGFTLVELLIAMLILAMGIMAVLSMQFTALGSAMASRDNSNAADIAQRLMHIMRMEAQQWRSDTISVDLASATTFGSGSGFAQTTLLPALDGDNINFVSLFSEPLDARMSNQGVTRYCAFGRGDYQTADDDVFHVQIAVVFPAANGVIGDDDCAALISGDASFDLDPSLDPEDDANHAQRHGYRVQYFDTHISRRGHLAPPLEEAEGEGEG